VAWFFHKSPPPAGKKPVLGSPIPRDDDRAGPAPPPPPSATPPGVTVHRFSGETRSGEEPLFFERKMGNSFHSWTRVQRLEAGQGPRVMEPTPHELAVVVLAGSLGEPNAAFLRKAGTGDVLFGAPAAFSAWAAGTDSPAVLLFEASSLPSPSSPHFPVGPSPLSPPAATLRHIRHDDLVGRGFPGITGIRLLHRTASLSAVRLGPPPGARWALVGLRSFAVFTGKITAIDGAEPQEVHSGELAVIADPSATLYLQAGNDAAVGVGLAGPDLVVALG
jgi:hypothetical protein